MWYFFIDSWIAFKLHKKILQVKILESSMVTLVWPLWPWKLDTAVNIRTELWRGRQYSTWGNISHSCQHGGIIVNIRLHINMRVVFLQIFINCQHDGTAVNMRTHLWTLEHSCQHYSYQHRGFSCQHKSTAFNMQTYINLWKYFFFINLWKILLLNIVKTKIAELSGHWPMLWFCNIVLKYVRKCCIDVLPD